jgi:hypothetical protein
MQAFTALINMRVQRVIHTATVLNDGRVFTFSNGLGELFDPRSLASEQVPGTGGPNIRDAHTATKLNDGSVLILGGSVPEFSENLLGAPILYDPRANAYINLKSDTSIVNRANHASVLLKDGRVLFTGGRTLDLHATNDIFVYNSDTRTFTSF